MQLLSFAPHLISGGCKPVPQSEDLTRSDSGQELLLTCADLILLGMIGLISKIFEKRKNGSAGTIRQDRVSLAD